MTGAIDFAIEYGRHSNFVGREGLLDELDRLLAKEPGDRWVVVTGGPAGDDELLEALAPTLRDVTVGRARVAGTLDHRWAVAYGLVLEGRNPATATAG